MNKILTLMRKFFNYIKPKSCRSCTYCGALATLDDTFCWKKDEYINPYRNICIYWKDRQN